MLLSKLPGSNQFPQQRSCPNENWVLCKNGEACIPKKWFCDGLEECSDGSDEENCFEKMFGLTFTTTARTTILQDSNPDCIEDKFRCGDGSCLPSRLVCDGLTDCNDGSDESDCSQENKSTTSTTEKAINDVQKCTKEEFQCDNGSCISSRWVCDGLSDCIDESDERDCKGKSKSSNLEVEITSPNSVLQSSAEVENSICEADQFECRFETSCIPERWVCDNQIDCKDGSDESDCDPSEINFWTLIYVYIQSWTRVVLQVC